MIIKFEVVLNSLVLVKFSFFNWVNEKRKWSFGVCYKKCTSYLIGSQFITEGSLLPHMFGSLLTTDHVFLFHNG